MDGLFQKGVNFTSIGRSGRQNIDLISALNADLEGSDGLNGFSIELQGDDLVVYFWFEGDDFALTDLEGLIHADLNLSNMQNIAEPDNF